MKIYTPVKAIRKKCLDCCCGQANEVRLCTCTECPLYPYRLGHRPPKNELATEGEDICTLNELDQKAVR